MILPQPSNDERRRRAVAVAGSLVLLAGMYSGLRGTAVPEFESGRAVIRKLDPLLLERYTSPEPKGPADERPREEAAPDVPTPDLEQQVDAAIDELATRFQPERSTVLEGDRSSEVDGVAQGIAAESRESRFTEVFGADDADAAVTAPLGRPSTIRRASAGRGIAVTTRPARSRPTGEADLDDDNLEVSVDAPSERLERPAPVMDVAIREYEADAFDRSDVEVLAEWMQKHPFDLPVGVKVHLNYSASFFTTVVPFASQGRDLELFLMFNPSLRELHIVLVENETSVYLVDRGFQEQSRSLREGTVRRLDGEIVAVDSRAGAASSDRAREFYNIFLSWWEIAKNDVR